MTMRSAIQLSGLTLWTGGGLNDVHGVSCFGGGDSKTFQQVSSSWAQSWCQRESHHSSSHRWGCPIPLENCICWFWRSCSKDTGWVKSKFAISQVTLHSLQSNYILPSYHSQWKYTWTTTQSWRCMASSSTTSNCRTVRKTGNSLTFLMPSSSTRCPKHCSLLLNVVRHCSESFRNCNRDEGRCQ